MIFILLHQIPQARVGTGNALVTLFMKLSTKKKSDLAGTEVL